MNVRLQTQLLVAFALVSVLATGALGMLLDRLFTDTLSERYAQGLSQTCSLAARDFSATVERQDRALFGACERGALADRAQVAIESGELAERRASLAAQVLSERTVLGLDELALSSRAETLTSAPEGLKPPALPRSPSLKGSFASNTPSLTFRCERAGKSPVELSGSRALAPLLSALEKSYDVTLSTEPPLGRSAFARSCEIWKAADGAALVRTIHQSERPFEEARAQSKRLIFFACGAAGFVALLVGLWLSRSLSRALADITVAVASLAHHEGAPIQERGSTETRKLASAFNQMILDLRQTQAALVKATRLSAWRDAARKIAHEIKNPLTPIRASVETMRRLRARQDPAFDTYFEEATDTILGEVSRMARLAGEFSQFARTPKPQLTTVDLVPLLTKQLQFVATSSPLVSFQSAGPSRLLIECDSDQICQVVLNLLQNARDAVEGRPAPQVRLEWQESDAWIEITVSDNGKGMTRDEQARLFEPYFTTKTTGTGLGLAVALQIAEEHHGKLLYLDKGAADAGATFQLRLPKKVMPTAHGGGRV